MSQAPTATDSSYVRVGPRSASGLGNLRFVSFNTWLIIINVAVFVLNNWVLNAPNLRVFVSFGNEYYNGVTADQMKRGKVLPMLLPHPIVPGWQFRPIVDPLATELDPKTNQPKPVWIGRQRFGTMPAIAAFGHFSTGKGFIPGFEVWRFVTFQFLHYNEIHLLLNMLGLWFAGGMVEQFLGSKRYAAFYLVCGIFGAMAYLLMNFLGYVAVHVIGVRELAIPGLLFNDIYTPLIGASAGVFGVLIAAARIEPNAMVNFMLLIPMRLRTAVVAMVVITLFNLFTGGPNAGGEAAHVGGILAGYYFIRNTHLLRDFFDILGNSHKPDRRGARPGAERGRARAPGDVAGGAALDEIVAKAQARGTASLSDEERRLLEEVAKDRYG